VLVIFFMKGPDFTHGEVTVLKGLPYVTVRSFGQRGWVRPGADNAGHRQEAAKALEFTRQALACGCYDLVVLDEVINAAALGLATWDSIIGLLELRPPQVDVILTGRGAGPALIEKADLVTDMCCLKHPFDRGIKARVGIDY
jgi:cob(I)alamin adenosyltransferase